MILGAKMSNPVFLQPSYQLFRKAVSEHIAPLVLIVGSGLSSEAGLPDWKALRHFIQEKIDDKYRSAKALGTPFSTGVYRQAAETKDYWLFFKLAKNLLTASTFDQLIKEKLDPAQISIPESYRELFTLNPKGVVTLNLDRLSGRALSEAHPGTHFIPVYGTELTKKWGLVSDERPYLVYLHGHITDSTTWIMDTDELREMTSTQAHQLFLSNLYLNNTVLFAGVSANDIALSGQLLSLNRAGFHPPRLFWLTSRNDSTTEKWASDHRVQLIHYKADQDAHHLENISAISHDIRGFRSIDQSKPEPVVRNTRLFSDIDETARTPREVGEMEPEFVRKYLSNRLRKQLTNTPEDVLYDKFLQFCHEYNYAIQTKSFYRHDTTEDRTFFDYDLIFPPLGTGNFGTVYQAKSKDGSFAAVKIMHSNIMYTREMLGGFRRGSSSMRILNKHNVDGVVSLIESFEMPPTIVMEHIPGNSLEELFQGIGDIPWATKVLIMCDVARIVDDCHKLPEMVLHRDLKPSNIMLCGLDWTDFSYERVVVLDFDMSWHKGSSEKDVVFESRDDFGYLAPEQTDPAQSVTARSTKVDSYGLGMTLFALLKGKHPIPNMPLSENFDETVVQATRQGYSGRWKALPRRLARIVSDSTRVDQDARLEFGHAKNRLKLVGDVLKITQTARAPAEIFAEEVLFRVASSRPYQWDDVFDVGTVHFGDGTIFGVELDADGKSIYLHVEYQDRGNREYNYRKQLLGQTKDHFEEWFRQGDNRIVDSSIDGGYLRIKGKMLVEFDLKTVDIVTEAVEKGLRFLHQIS